MRKASFFARCLALAIDIVVVTSLSVLLCTATLPGYLVGLEGISLSDIFGYLLLFGVTSFLTSLAYFTYLTMGEGQTIGKAIFGIRVVERNGGNVKFFRSFLRSIGYAFSAVPCLLGFLLASLPWKRSLHDLIAGTLVVKEVT
jgi:uncharacterized RDD family membrane protein YckC